MNLLDFFFLGRHTGDKGLNLLGSFLQYILMFIFDTNLNLLILLGEGVEKVYVYISPSCLTGIILHVDKGQFITWIKMDDTRKFIVEPDSIIVLYF